MDYIQRLRCMAIGDVLLAERDGQTVIELDPKSVALVRLAALVAVGGAIPSFGASTDAAISAGTTASEIVDVLVSIVSVVGVPCVVSAAPRVALALGYDIENDTDPRPAG